MRKFEGRNSIIAFLLLLLLSCCSASTQAIPHQLPDLIFKGSVTTILGHELGYLRPTKGARLEILFSKLEAYDSKIDFPNTNEEEISGYVPLPDKFKIVDIEGGNRQGEWSSFRAVAEKGKHKVTMDVVRKPGTGHHDNTEIWLLIESRQRITGILEIHGRVYRH